MVNAQMLKSLFASRSKRLNYNFLIILVFHFFSMPIKIIIYVMLLLLESNLLPPSSYVYLLHLDNLVYRYCVTTQNSGMWPAHVPRSASQGHASLLKLNHNLISQFHSHKAILKEIWFITSVFTKQSPNMGLFIS